MKNEKLSKVAPKSSNRSTDRELKTERPFGEKDEVKRAEDKLRKAAKKPQ
jgi:hypothetical protein